ncbi:polysaccharide pyruvyl transferase family protein [Demequina zhanjiangensis]|uniref:Polysaccharide pyruvyl transferase family protein n=1 Tax=Demequina zhanjiangensis TaxID=3051659 RepID=A0ABT8G0U1_9MICO|nr:polysaccharide pyruvyl transferase family protein [Demequina sp. SYSU T00b26]MDN4472748.1 polysaccharide pyruvyl transferase family protein [Demequina sp. SYSU T00b26]
MKILLMNSDLAANRGDRAIAAGLIALARDTFPDAQITLVSQEAERDGEWFGASVLPQNIHSLNPLDWWRLLRAARRADLVLWGGGELLKDYTNRLGVWYWSLKMHLVSVANAQLVGVFQGIGPTSAPSSRWLIVRTVSRTKAFLTRDEQSKERLEAWGVRPGLVTSSFDSAVYASDVDPDVKSPASRFAIVAPRRWFHYTKGGWLPHRWRRGQGPSPRSELLEQRVVQLIDLLVAQHGDVVLLPMHMGEDPDYARALRDRAAHPHRVHVLADDDLGPRALRSLVSRADVMIALRLHAGIVATSVGVPTVTYFYVDKGRLFAHQVDADAYTRPMERLLEDDALEDFSAMSAAVVDDDSQRAAGEARIAEMRARLREDFREAVSR